MKLLRRTIKIVLVFCSALWVTCSGKRVLPPSCNSTLVFSTEISSLSEGSWNINLKSLSPWTWRTTTVQNQIPSTIWEANCSSEFCYPLKPGQLGHHNLNSMPIYQNILVLTRMEGSHCYTASYRSVAVGCTCIRANVGQN